MVKNNQGGYENYMFHFFNVPISIHEFKLKNTIIQILFTHLFDNTGIIQYIISITVGRINSNCKIILYSGLFVEVCFKFI